MQLINDLWAIIAETPHYWWIVKWDVDNLSEIMRYPKIAHMSRDLNGDDDQKAYFFETLEGHAITLDEWTAWFDDNHCPGQYYPVYPVTFDPPPFRELKISRHCDRGPQPVSKVLS
jgi:hypothetical protein